MNPRMQSLFGPGKGALLGVVHLSALPGTADAPARAADAMREMLERALADAAALEAGGLDGAIIENFGDAPFHKSAVPASIVAALTAACVEVRRATKFP